MNDLERMLHRFPPLEAPDRVWERLRSPGSASPRRFFKEGFMVAAAAGLLAWLGFVLVWTPEASMPAEPGVQESETWLEREPAEADVPASDRIVIEALLADLGGETGSRREAAQQLLEARLESAIPFLRKAAKGNNPDLRTSAQSLVDQWEERHDRMSLPKLLAEARKEAKPRDEWKAVAQRAVAGDATAAAELRKIGWSSAPVVAAAVANADPSSQHRARLLLRELLLPLMNRVYPAVRLICRKKNEQDYKDSAYSFRYATRDAVSVKNEIDVVYNLCGQLHFTPYGGRETYLADAGKAALGDVTELPKQGWRRANCVLPVEGRVYVVEIRAEGVSYTYKFEVLNLTARSIEFRWAVIGEPRTAPGIDPARGANGAFGTCNGKHAEY